MSDLRLTFHTRVTSQRNSWNTTMVRKCAGVAACAGSVIHSDSKSVATGKYTSNRWRTSTVANWHIHGIFVLEQCKITELHISICLSLPLPLNGQVASCHPNATGAATTSEHAKQVALESSASADSKARVQIETSWRRRSEEILGTALFLLILID